MLVSTIPSHKSQKLKLEHTFRTLPSFIRNLPTPIWKKQNAILQNRSRTMKATRSSTTPATTFAFIAAAIASCGQDSRQKNAGRRGCKNNAHTTRRRQQYSNRSHL